MDFVKIEQIYRAKMYENMNLSLKIERIFYLDLTFMRKKRRYDQ